ncbi:MAG: DsbA family protein [Pseudomonadota bacterium]
MLSVERRNARREKAEKARKAAGAPHVVEYFHQTDDPYSHLLVQLLPEFMRRYDVELRCHVVSPPDDAAAPDRPRLEAYARQDAARLAPRLGLSFSDPGAQPDAARIAAAKAALLQANEHGEFLRAAPEIGAALWFGGSLPEIGTVPDLSAGDARRDELGHYLGGMLYYAGEWYWGPDRLHYLESRLRDLGAARDEAPSALIYPPPVVPAGTAAAAPETAPVLHWYLSFRSPYTGIVADRVKALADAYGAELKLRFVLPMVMRGMTIPRHKGRYIPSDTAREAERLGVAFGNACDPVGKPVERGYAILPRAIELGRGFEFVRSFLSGVWSEGIDAGSDSGLKRLTERAGLSWDEMKPLLGGDHWREEAEANQEEMFSYSIWGVPSFRVGDVATWGQDRLWVIEDALAGMTGRQGGT